MLWLQATTKTRNDELITTVTSAQTGHLQIQNQDYIKDHSLGMTFQLPDEENERIKSLLPPGTIWSDRAYFGVMLSSGEQSAPLVLVGIHPEDEARVTIIADKVSEGNYLTPDTDPDCPTRQILIGKPLAELLNVDVGSKLVLLGPAADGTLGNDLFRVQGIFDSGSRDFDKSVAYAPLTCVQKTAAIQGVHERAIRLPDVNTINSVHQKIVHEIKAPLKLYNWTEVQPKLAMMTIYNKASTTMFSGLLLIVIIFGTMNTLFMSVFERTREFGLMTALGTQPQQMGAIILLEGLLLGLLSSLLGVALGSAILLYHGHYGFDLRPLIGENGVVGDFKLSLTLYPQIHILPFIQRIFIINFVVVISAIVPAVRVMRMNTIAALRNPT